MAVQTITAWLERKRRDECIFSIILSLLGLGAGAIALVLTSGFLYLFASIITGTAFRTSQSLSALPAVITCLLIVFLFIDGARERPDDLSVLSKAGFWVFRELLCAGPRLIFAACHSAARAMQAARLDIEACEKVLSYLAVRNASVSREELLQAFPGLTWPQLISQLTLLAGVLFFRPDLSRVTLTEPLRLELRQFLPRQETSEPHEQSAESIPITEPRRLSYYELLGVTPMGSLAEIKMAYRSRIKECHPDRFSCMGQEAQQLAEEWSKAINAAYDALAAQHAAQVTGHRV